MAIQYRLALLAAVLVVAACTKESPPTLKDDAGRPETRSLEAADPMGYNGKAIRKQVDSALNANDAANAKLQKEANEANDL